MCCCKYLPLNLITTGLLLIQQSFQQDYVVVTPSINLTSGIYTDSSTETRATTVWSGQELYWILAGHEEYDHKPEDCIAYEGLIITKSARNKTIIRNGCSTDTSLVTDFAFVNGTGKKVFSTIYAFRFFHSTYVTFECNVRVCPTGAAECTIDCSDSRRRATRRTCIDYQQYNAPSSWIKVEEPTTSAPEDMTSSSSMTFQENSLFWLLGLVAMLTK